MTKMSSMDLFQVCMCGFPRFCSCFSIFPIKRLAYDGAILVPIAVPCFCK